MWPKLFGVNYLMIIPSFFATNGKAMEYVTHLLFQTRKHLICIVTPFEASFAIIMNIGKTTAVHSGNFTKLCIQNT